MSNLSKYKNGFYCEATIKDKIFLKFLDNVKEKIKQTFPHINFEEPPYKPHITVIYSKTKPSKIIEESLERYIDNLYERISVNVDKLITLPYYDKKCIALEFDKSPLFKINETLVKIFKLKPSFPDYLCHTSLLVYDSKESLDLTKVNIDKNDYLIDVEYNCEDLDD